MKTHRERVPNNATIVLARTAVPEVSNDQFVAACIAFQQAKSVLSQHLGSADLHQLNTVSGAVYDLANKALRRKMKEAPVEKTRAVKNGTRVPFREVIAQAVRGRRKFTIPEVIEALKKRQALPEAVDVGAYISATLSTNTDMFKRIERGLYTLKTTRRRLALKAAPKGLPEATP